ncbi:hypothetical protein [Halosegnis sp.]|uniref:DUF7345 domain-containing protein n=1 Tax=Halosegnis sp. TaxID=2864959 RepID=UPI0035D4D608
MTRVSVVVAVLLVVASGTLAGAAGTSAGTGAPSPDGVLLQAAIDADGAATWTVEHRFRLDDENATEAFETLQAAIENGTEYRDRFRARMEATVADAENATGREMSIEDARIALSTTDGGETGNVTL